jgi:hypothetical protein
MERNILTFKDWHRIYESNFELDDYDFDDGLTDDEVYKWLDTVGREDPMFMTIGRSEEVKSITLHMDNVDGPEYNIIFRFKHDSDVDKEDSDLFGTLGIISPILYEVNLLYKEKWAPDFQYKGDTWTTTLDKLRLKKMLEEDEGFVEVDELFDALEMVNWHVNATFQDVDKLKKPEDLALVLDANPMLWHTIRFVPEITDHVEPGSGWVPKEDDYSQFKDWNTRKHS